MSNIGEIDKNLKVETQLEEKDLHFFDSREKPFEIYGLMYEENRFVRMPKSVAESANQGVAGLFQHTAGGRVRFKTNAKHIAIKCRMSSVTRFPHMPLSGSSGFDMYVGDEYEATFMPPPDMKDGYEAIRYFADEKEREIIINFPLYNVVDELLIGLPKGASLSAPAKYRYQVPIVYYGSSITQGGCASRPGTCYQNIIANRFDCDYINLGFSGSCIAEDVMCDYIRELDMSIFVLDYDHNAPNADYLEKTHERFYKRFREKQPDTPFIMVSKPDPQCEADIVRRDIIKRTYENAVAAGDKNVRFVDGGTLWVDRSFCSVDTTHPNDLGMWGMAKGIGDVIAEFLHK